MKQLLLALGLFGLTCAPAPAASLAKTYAYFSIGGSTLEEFMLTEARRAEKRTGMKIPTTDAESFIRASARAGLLRIVH